MQAISMNSRIAPMSMFYGEQRYSDKSRRDKLQPNVAGLGEVRSPVGLCGRMTEPSNQHMIWNENEIVRTRQWSPFEDR